MLVLGQVKIFIMCLWASFTLGYICFTISITLLYCVAGGIYISPPSLYSGEGKFIYEVPLNLCTLGEVTVFFCLFFMLYCWVICIPSCFKLCALVKNICSCFYLPYVDGKVYIFFCLCVTSRLILLAGNTTLIHRIVIVFT